MEIERKCHEKRNDDTSGTRAGPRHSRAIDGSRLALLRGYPGHHRQAQRDRLEHRTASAGEPAAALGLQSHASLLRKIEERFWPPELSLSLRDLCLEIVTGRLVSTRLLVGPLSPGTPGALFILSVSLRVARPPCSRPSGSIRPRAMDSFSRR